MKVFKNKGSLKKKRRYGRDGHDVKLLAFFEWYVVVRTLWSCKKKPQRPPGGPQKVPRRAARGFRKVPRSVPKGV